MQRKEGTGTTMRNTNDQYGFCKDNRTTPFDQLDSLRDNPQYTRPHVGLGGVDAGVDQILYKLVSALNGDYHLIRNPIILARTLQRLDREAYLNLQDWIRENLK